MHLFITIHVTVLPIKTACLKLGNLLADEGQVCRILVTSTLTMVHLAFASGGQITTLRVIVARPSIHQIPPQLGQ
jgi:hypothetical protein